MIEFARLDGRNEPCAQSCMMMNVRTRRPAAGSASRSVTQYGNDRERYIRYITPARGTSVLISWVIARATLDPWYRETIPRQSLRLARSCGCVNETPRPRRGSARCGILSGKRTQRLRKQKGPVSAGPWSVQLCVAPLDWRRVSSSSIESNRIRPSGQPPNANIAECANAVAAPPGASGCYGFPGASRRPADLNVKSYVQ